jgi:hypothetical protein
VTGCRPVAQPPTWRASPPYLQPPREGWPSYTPRHRAPILVAFYNLHRLQWDFLFPAHHTGIVLCYVYIKTRQFVQKLRLSPNTRVYEHLNIKNMYFHRIRKERYRNGRYENELYCKLQV